jgi:hypothetical protein
MACVATSLPIQGAYMGPMHHAKPNSRLHDQTRIVLVGILTKRPVCVTVSSWFYSGEGSQALF